MPTRQLTPLYLALLLLTTSCSHIHHLREAQTAFSQAATLENLALTQPTANTPQPSLLLSQPQDAIANQLLARTRYETALYHLKQANPKKLQHDGLLTSALTLQALTEWRLGLYTNALTTRQKADLTSSPHLPPRDQAILLALPALIQIDLAHDTILQLPPHPDPHLLTNQFLPLLVGPQGATSQIQQARNLLPPEHPLQLYLLQCQLSAYRNFQVAHQKILLQNPPPNHPATLNAQNHLREIQSLGTSPAYSTTTPALLHFWSRFGLNPSPPARNPTP